MWRQEHLFCLGFDFLYGDPKDKTTEIQSAFFKRKMRLINVADSMKEFKCKNK